MSAKAITEATGKDILNRHLNVHGAGAATCRFATVNADTDWSKLSVDQPWLLTTPLVVKPDQLIKRRGKLGLIGVKKSFEQVKQWIGERINKDQKIGNAVGKLRNFIIEPFLPHTDAEEMYVCIYSHRSADTILFYHQGGVDIGDVDAKAVKLDVPVNSDLSLADVKSKLLKEVKDASQRERIAKFIGALYATFVDLYFTYLEINPLVVTADNLYILDLAAKLDSTADFICRPKWGEIDYPPPFGRDAYPEEAYIADLDAKSGASLKLTILNRNGRIWTMVAGGGASVIYSDTICDLGGASELANYGEYSGAPSEQQTYEYAKTILNLMTSSPKHPDGKVLITGGGIANFTNVAATFQGIITALREFQPKLVEHNVSIFVRRAGPNYQEGLRRMRDFGGTLGIPLHVFGPETHMTAICGMALGKRPIPKVASVEFSTANFLLPGGQQAQADLKAASDASSEALGSALSSTAAKSIKLPPISADEADNGSSASSASGHRNGSSLTRKFFSNTTKAIVWGMQQRAVQSMLDFDFICRREEPSVVAMVYPFTGDHKQKYYWGHKEILIPVYKKMSDAIHKNKEVDVLVSFASLRSAYESTLEVLEFPQIRTVAIIAEGIPENMTRKLILEADKKGVAIIGPATVGGVKPGCFKIGNTGGMLDNILHSKLYRPGSVAYVSRSGGMSNELNNIISKATDGVIEGIAIGGDRYPGSTFMDHIMRYQADPETKLIVLLGEVGGTEEYDVCAALQDGRITKPLVAWCIGTCASMFTSEVQFGHAGSCANSDRETATAKNKALREARAYVPDSFDTLGELIHHVYSELVKTGRVVPKEEVPPPTVPMDYSWARELGLIRKPASFMTSICDERGQELIYAGMPISEVLSKDVGIGGVISLLWFQRCLPSYVCKFFEMCLMVTADHGPAVSGAHNTIVCARAGKDLVSSVVSGLLTIGDRFGGALDGSARQFSEAYDTNLHPMEFVNKMRKEGKLILGIGHRVKSINNPDVRVKIIKEFVLENFPACPLLRYALEVEKITTNKKPNLILNVDGVIATAFVDMLRNSGSFTSEEAQEYINVGAINSLFVLGRSIGFIGHYMDQKRLKQGLYRHPWDDISYVIPEQYN
ncbi:ATP-citrate synthase isoform X1 [Drosophila persimilis]|uniref:ATP-citrate synthase n=1 Tax=Drosophila pseudoobscura pseudoobscura TaxID=46245 RepID=A0A6I8VGC9_DROPS|nr:ATP-citrate synthase isoform X1 [Drosophila pseudoobscura]XP_015040768.1 ATP-citrate synthase isoform X1 [Drosophila pseudoobscura]XP_015040769.1 ATP-citrate synthase isoform X1 [Drosophila pseudoobscura]XP_026842368.1 ATP-citrate synthase isoform X1 [Drosophila persimilis]XP_026842369.1 ATP-citrate synthase isoform X1 [Drosophila persimilis]XP_026842370.1 ATP-citrate synthase isoform X1 [Drosophila persimilis]